MVRAKMLFVGVVLLTFLLGAIDQAFGWIDVYAFLDWLILGRGGLVELANHITFIIAYAGFLLVGIYEGVGGNLSLLSEFTILGLISAVLQLGLKFLAIFYNILDFFIMGVLLTPIAILIEFTMSVILVLIESFGIFTVAGLTIGFILLLFGIFYIRSGISTFVRTTADSNFISQFIDALGGKTPGETLDDAIKGVPVGLINANDILQADVYPDGMRISDLTAINTRITNWITEYTAGFRGIRNALQEHSSQDTDQGDSIHWAAEQFPILNRPYFDPTLPPPEPPSEENPGDTVEIDIGG